MAETEQPSNKRAAKPKRNESSQQPKVVDRPMRGVRIGSMDYRSWDNMDMEMELDKTDKLMCKQDRTVIQAGFKLPTAEVDSHSPNEREWFAQQDRIKGNEYLKAGEIDRALVYYQRSLRFDERCETYSNIALAFIKVKRFSESIRACLDGLGCARGMTSQIKYKLLLRQGRALQSIGDLNGARNSFQQLLESHPNDAGVISTIAHLKAEMAKPQYRRLSIITESD